MKKGRSLTVKLMTVLLAVIMVVSVFPVSAMADGTTITAYVTVSAGGRISQFDDDTRFATCLPVTLNADNATVDGAFEAVHEKYFDGGAAGYTTAAGGFGDYITKFWGTDTDGNCGYYVNGAMSSGLNAELKNGDQVEFYAYEGDYYSGTLESYSTFGDFTREVVAGGTLNFTLQKEQYDSSYNMYYADVAGAAVYVSFGEDGFKDKVATSDVNGSFNLDFEEAGTYYITAQKDGETVTEITAPICTVTVYDFKDISGHWGEGFIRESVSREMFSGTSATTFEPNSGMTRAMVATVLYKLAGSPAVSGSSGFADVPDGTWYAVPVAWAKQQEIVSGYSETQFGSNDKVTREQFVKMLMSFAEVSGYAMGVSTADISSFSDSTSVAEWAAAAMQWAVANGYITGTPEGKLMPQGTLTRAECATVLTKFLPYTVQEGLNKTANYLNRNIVAGTGSVGGEWTMVALARSGNASDKYKSDYYSAVSDLVTSQSGELSSTKYTEYSRVIIGLTAAGYDATDVEGYDLTKKLANYDAVTSQGITGVAYALIALDCGNYAIPTDSSVTTQATRQMYIDYMLGKQLSDGGFALTGTTADPDVTAIVIQSLAKYSSDTDVSGAIADAVACLSDIQNDDGGFTGYAGRNSQSSAQVIIALCEAGISPESESFTKNGNSAVDAMMRFFNYDGSFKNVMSESSNVMATEQAMAAMTAAAMYMPNGDSYFQFVELPE